MFTSLFRLLFPPPSPTPNVSEPNAFDRWRQAIAPLGTATGEIIFCLGGSDPRNSTYFDPFLTNALAPAALEYFSRLEQRNLQTAPTPPHIIAHALVAAGLFTCGHHAALTQILEYAPERLVHLDHGAGHCHQAPFRAILRILPMPTHLQSMHIWSRDNQLMQQFQQWYDDHHQELIWNEKERRYSLRTE